jgi:hypothetical protein
MDLAPSLLVALTGLLGTIAGIVLAREGRKDTLRQQIAATRVAENELHLRETQQALDAQGEVIVMQQRQIALLLEQNAQHERSRVALIEDLVTLRGVVLDEVAKAAADEAIDKARHTPSS